MTAKRPPAVPGAKKTERLHHEGTKITKGKKEEKHRVEEKGRKEEIQKEVLGKCPGLESNCSKLRIYKSYKKEYPNKSTNKSICKSL